MKKIRLQQGLTFFEFELDEIDAEILMAVLKRNKIWFADITKRS